MSARELLGRSLHAGSAGAQRATQPGGGNTLCLEIGNEGRQLLCHARAGVCQARQEMLACQWAERRAGVSGLRQHLGQEALEALDPDTERQPSLGQLAPVACLVGLGRHHQQRLLPPRHVSTHSIQQDARLAGVGGSGYECDRHVAILAHPPDGSGPIGAARLGPVETVIP